MRFIHKKKTPPLIEQPPQKSVWEVGNEVIREYCAYVADFLMSHAVDYDVSKTPVAGHVMRFLRFSPEYAFTDFGTTNVLDISAIVDREVNLMKEKSDQILSYFHSINNKKNGSTENPPDYTSTIVQNYESEILPAIKAWVESAVKILDVKITLDEDARRTNAKLFTEVNNLHLLSAITSGMIKDRMNIFFGEIQILIDQRDKEAREKEDREERQRCYEKHYGSGSEQNEKRTLVVSPAAAITPLPLTIADLCDQLDVLQYIFSCFQHNMTVYLRVVKLMNTFTNPMYGTSSDSTLSIPNLFNKDDVSDQDDGNVAGSD